ncbi:MAG: endonuclease/exonuclease/phosphatase family protein [Bacteroidaceae bacterium]|nr:endonuclease/exonuclease/phosphatase family protein [Bacteroidaceae bacterium]
MRHLPFALCALPLAASVVAAFVSPATFPAGALLALGFPLFYLLCLAAFVVALLLRRRTGRAWVTPLLALALATSPARSYLPLNIARAIPAGADTLRILSFNTRNFGGHEADSDGRGYVAGFMADAGADIVCFQEGAGEPEFYTDEALPLLRERFPYTDLYLPEHGSPMGILSRWPVVGRTFVTRSGTNHAIAYTLVRPGGDTLRVVNCHLASVGYTLEQLDGYADGLHSGFTRSGAIGRAADMARAFCQSAERRARMADTVANYVAAHRGESLIVCGDLNDTPVSYTARTVRGPLTDAYRAAGHGLGRSYNRSGIAVRIDHLFCSPDWTPARCSVVPVFTSSDHYPLLATLYRPAP